MYYSSSRTASWWFRSCMDTQLNCGLRPSGPRDPGSRSAGRIWQLPAYTSSRRQACKWRSSCGRWLLLHLCERHIVDFHKSGGSLGKVSSECPWGMGDPRVELPVSRDQRGLSCSRNGGNSARQEGSQAGSQQTDWYRWPVVVLRVFLSIVSTAQRSERSIRTCNNCCESHS